MFYPFDKVTVQHEFMPSDENRTVYTAEENGEYIVRIEDADGKTERKAKVGAETEYGMVSLLFDAFCAHTGKMPRWGMLTGIHPIKLLRQLTEQHGEAEAARLFREKYFVSNEKTALAVRTLRAQKPITDKVRENDYSLYISVPFCPTRCAYCSFVSQSVEKAKKQIPEYHRLLLEELKETAKVADALGLNLRAVYVGGGTPTTFSAEQLSEMIRVVKDSFDMSQCEELTVEAGRPDTIDRAKLDALLKSGVSRISINRKPCRTTYSKTSAAAIRRSRLWMRFTSRGKRALRISIWTSLSACRVTRMRRSVTQSKRSLRLTLRT